MTRITTYHRIAEIGRRVFASEITALHGRDEILEILLADMEKREVVRDLMHQLDYLAIDELKPREVYRRDQG